MAIVPPPPPLTSKAFLKRKKQLIKEGKPLTMFNLDPALGKWHKSQTRYSIFAIICLGVGGTAMLFISMIITLSNIG